MRTEKSLQPRQMPKAVSKNSSNRQIAQTIRLTGPTRLLITTRTSMVTPSTKPMAQAKRFCGAPTYSGCCLRTNHCPMTRLGA